MKANLSLTQRDGSIHVIQTVSNCFQNENKSYPKRWLQEGSIHVIQNVRNWFQTENKALRLIVLPKEMAPGSLWIGNVKVNVVHVLVRDRARIKLERKK